jgi:RimJ/RimL family protein N-acetyltransferase
VTVRLEGFGLGADRLDETAAEGMWKEAKRFVPHLTLEEVRRRVKRSGDWDDHMLELGIIEEGRNVGSMQARRCDRINFPGNYEIGLDVFSEEDRGRGVGRRAVALLTTYLFEEHGARRVQLTTDEDNRAMRMVAERLSFTREGTLRAFAHTPEGHRDYVLYAMTSADFKEAKDLWASIC